MGQPTSHSTYAQMTESPFSAPRSGKFSAMDLAAIACAASVYCLKPNSSVTATSRVRKAASVVFTFDRCSPHIDVFYDLAKMHDYPTRNEGSWCQIMFPGTQSGTSTSGLPPKYSNARSCDPSQLSTSCPQLASV